MLNRDSLPYLQLVFYCFRSRRVRRRRQVSLDGELYHVTATPTVDGPGPRHCGRRTA